MKKDLTPAEQVIMEALWESKHWMTISELIKIFEAQGKEWKRQTVNTFLAHLIEKGLVVKNGRKYIYAYTKEEYNARVASELLNTLYGGSLKKFVAALSGSNTLKSEDIKALRDYLDNFQE